MKLNSVVYALPVPCMLQTSRVIRSTTPVKQPPPATDPFQYLFEFSDMSRWTRVRDFSGESREPGKSRL